MAQNNGKMRTILWLAGCLFTIIVVIVLPALASNIIQNDKQNTKEHTEIRSERYVCIEKLRKELNDNIKDIKTEQFSMGKIQSRILASVERLEKKLDE